MVEFIRFAPPSSRGPGRGPLKAKTGVRVPLGAPAVKNRSADDVERFLASLRFENIGKLDDLDTLLHSSNYPTKC
jgi:hypothetical protein